VSAVAGQSNDLAVIPQNVELVHFGDIIDVDFVGGFEFDWRGTLTPDGFLDGLDGYSEPIFGLCRTEAQIAGDIARIYGKILRSPNVIVRIVDRSNRAVAKLEGAVRTPTRFRIGRKVTLSELIVLAGGLIDGTSGDISIFRPINMSCALTETTAKNDVEIVDRANGSQTISIKISEILTGRPDSNPTILSGDMIMVNRAAPVYVIGAVNNPRPIHSAGQLNVTGAVAMAGGLAKDADGGKFTISRREGSEVKAIDGDLGSIDRKQADDIPLKPFDIVDISGKGVARKKYAPVMVADQAVRLGGELPLRIIE